MGVPRFRTDSFQRELGFDRSINEHEAGTRGDEIIVAKLDRLSRSIADTFRLVEDLGRHGVSIRSLAEGPRGAAKSDATLNLGLRPLFAQAERQIWPAGAEDCGEDQGSPRPQACSRGEGHAPYRAQLPQPLARGRGHLRQRASMINSTRPTGSKRRQAHR